MRIVVVGLSHRTAPVHVREKLSIQDHAVEGAIAQLGQLPHVEEVAILSTCNRLEIYAAVRECQQGVREVSQFLAERGGLPLSQLRRHLFVLLHQDATRHLMRVSAGLDSLVLGEGQILAQVKHGHKLAQKHKGLGRLLDRLFKQALAAGKRVRSETNIGTGAMSISSAAVELAQTQVPDLGRCRIAIIGAGKMARLLVQHLLSKGATQIAIVNRSRQRANELAAQFPAANLQLCELSELIEVVATSDIAFTSTAASEPLLDRAKIEAALAPDCRLLLCDIAVPRNVSEDVGELPQVDAFNVDDLKAVVAKNAESRRQMAREAEVLLEEEVRAYELWQRSLDAVPTISCLREKVETIREQELEKALSRLGTEFAEKHKETIEALTRGIVNKILHEPMVELRAQQDIEMRRRTLQSLQLLFKLDVSEQQYG
ncbi:glutamyl-tRNA reductase [Rubidibacter lacunae KORDI 51-2]|uniref:Glutamyl-tRNA reductase n=1 Tax=Rubidibacter lacunae KORDI 51-2 TaxID=582515 RepID=U5DE33_9CHRO|nr:glutamyl-tRNA reductase [Rubidibacter lacunae]ERN39881.1 glutamyl-tRNA reductase [Rubidibacter lacunae KORDI 51-2]